MENEIREKVERLLKKCISGYYVRCIIQDLYDKETGASFIDDIIKEIKNSVSWDNYKSYDEEDLKMCIGRVLLSRIETNSVEKVNNCVNCAFYDIEEYNCREFDCNMPCNGYCSKGRPKEKDKI